MAAVESSQFAHLSPTHPTRAASCNHHAHECRWWPYSNSNDFGANTAVILIILLCALVCALILNAAIRCFLRGAHHLPDQLPQTQRELVHNSKPSFESGAKQLMVAPILVYAIGMKLGGAEADCAICLSEFVEGEGIRVLGSCQHAFHVHCIEKWLSSHSSCPTCRSSCLASFPTSDCCPENNNNFRQLEITDTAQEHIISNP
ncbi:RING-H2 finger protein ATL79-like [Mercurialis annua]|uniref:RING-H2 finger protein ATL79-like n=1 Tax=Mercurialis annua TaxID=3986 RepID=UPI00215F58EB|nr:RING-H2 finger protein ATL79-like [Mercurialis annua]